MKKIVLMGRSECGKTTLTQALKGEKIQYHKTQYVNNFDVVIDTPGEYAQTKNLGYALALYSYEADVVGLLLSAVFSVSAMCYSHGEPGCDRHRDEGGRRGRRPGAGKALAFPCRMQENLLCEFHGE